MKITVALTLEVPEDATANYVRQLLLRLEEDNEVMVESWTVSFQQSR